jgi:MFS family permease
MLLFGIVFLSLGTISVFIQEKFRVDALQVASLASSLPFGMLAGSLIFGPVVDRYGYKILLIICAGMIVLALELAAFTQSFAVLQISFLLIGVAGGVINGGTNALAADITPERKGAKLSLLGVFYGIGALGMPVVIGLLTRRFSYETVISIIGFFILLPMIYFTTLRFPEPKIRQGFPLRKVWAMLKEPLLILTGVILFFESALEGITGNWTTTFLKSAGIPPGNALFALSCQVAAITAVRLLLSSMFRYIPGRMVMYLSFLMILAGAGLLAALSSFPAVLAAIFCLGAGFAAVFPVILGYVGELYPKMTGTAFSIVIVMALAGNTLLNYIVGVVARARGIGLFPYILLFCAVLMILAYGITIRKISKKISI